MSLSSKILGLNFSDTIAAIATASGQAGISVIRISGPQSVIIADKIFTGKHKPSRAKPNTLHFGKIIDPSTKKILDEVIVAIFKSPNSYTGEDMIEISCHGSDYVASEIQKLITKLGARLAEPGEFTKRRVFNGKMDITQAEAILDLVSAKTEKTCHLAIEQLQGKLTGYIQNLTKDLSAMLAQMENLLEFEENQMQSRQEFIKITSQIKKIIENIETTVNKNQEIKFLKNGVYCVIVGKPNVGKSSLFNRLVQTDKAIVTNIPGTTRDSIEHSIIINGITFHLIDTAGLKIINKPRGAGKIEAMGIEKSRNWLQSADFILAIFDNSHTFTKQDNLVYDVVKNRPHLLVLNKIDLKPKFRSKLLNHHKTCKVSAKYNQGISKLKSVMANYYAKKISTSSNNYLALNTRHTETLSQVNKLLNQAVTDKYLDVSIMHLRNAIDLLGTITNPVSNEQIFDSIFAQFCIGK